MTDHIYFEDLCSASVDGMLTRAEKKELEAHLNDCPACRKYLDDLRELRGLWRELDAPLPAGLHESIMAAAQTELAASAGHPASGVSEPLHVTNAPSVEEPVKKKDLHEVAVPIGAPVKMYTKKHMRSMVAMLVAAAACVTLVLSGGLPDLVGVMSGGGSAADGAAAASEPTMGISTAATTADAAAAETPMQPSARIAAGAEESITYASGATGAPAKTGTEQDAENGASLSAPELPEALHDRAFDGVYLATGAGELPVIEKAMLLMTEDDRSYYSLPNDISVIETVMESLHEAGYTVSMTAVSDLGTENKDSSDSGASEVLLIVRTE